MKLRVLVAGPALACAVLSLAGQVSALLQPPLCPRSDATAATACLRRLYFDQDYDDGRAEGAALVARFPQSPQLHAWLAANLANDLREDSALAVTERMRALWPQSAWTQFARALVLQRWPLRWPEAKAAARRARDLAPGERDMWWLAAHQLRLDRKPAAAAALVDSALGRVGASPELLVMQGMVLSSAARTAEGVDSALVARAEGALQRAIALDSASGNAWNAWGDQRERAHDLAGARLAARWAAALAPRSVLYQLIPLVLVWRQPGLTAEQKRDSARAWYERLRAGRGESPPLLKAGITAFRGFGDDSSTTALEGRLLAAYPTSVEAEWLLSDRPNELMGEVYRRSVPDTLQAIADVRRQLREFIARPVHRSTSFLGSAYLQLFNQVQHDSTVSNEEMSRLVAGMERYSRSNASSSHVGGALALADRGIDLERAERLARAAPQLVTLELQLLRSSNDTEGEYLDDLARERAGAYDALGWVYFKEGRTKDAARLEAQALATRRDFPLALYHSALMAEAAGQRTRALDLFARGYVAERHDEYRPNEAALLRLYRARHGSDQGYDAFVNGLQEQERVHRRARVLATRVAQPQALPPFELKVLGGGSFSSDSLRGKVAIINFWGLWCGPCMHELPQIQELFDRFRADPGVVVLTIDNDPDPTAVEKFLAQKKLSFPVLLDDGELSKARVHSYPTTWFLDRQGRIAFEQTGESDALLEEAGWRVEALKAQRPVTAS